MALREELGTIPQVKCQTKNTLPAIPYKIGAMKLMVTQGSVQFSRSIMSSSLWPHGLQHARLPCPSPTPKACSNSCPSSQWCHPTITSRVIPFSSHLQSFPASGSFPMNQFFTSGGQNIGVSASASVLPMTIQDWFPLGWTGWISLQLIKRNTPACCISESNLTFTFYNSLVAQW